jgi:hypothetical protein
VKGDRFLIAIVAGVVLLVVVVVAVVLLGTEEPTYREGAAPDDVAYNYLLALHKEEYARAYGYLSPDLPGYPETVDDFRRDVMGNRWSFDLGEEVSLAVEGMDVTGDSAMVMVRRTHFSGGGLFDSGQYSFTFDVTLGRHDGAWKIEGADRYWASCWDQSNGCR